MTNDTAHPVALQLTVTITALVYEEPEVGGYSAEVPALPGCYTEGETLDEVRVNLREAVEGWLNSAHDAAANGRAKPE
jgi:predicted RNase H-like HicB family nuclease